MKFYSLIDSHAHLDQITDIQRVLERARENGVSAIIGVGMDLASNRRILELADMYPGFVYPALGYHPASLKENEIWDTLDFVENNLEQAVAIGEIGLDYKVKIPKKLQKQVFASFLNMAAQNDKPVIIHARLSHSRCLEMVRNTGIIKAVFHWYSGPLDVLDAIIEAGYFISATPALIYSPKHQAAIHYTPLEQILLETDCPERYGELTSQPADVLISLGEVAGIKGVDPQAVAIETSRNAEEFFGLAEM